MKIETDPLTQAFYQGVFAGSETLKAMDEIKSAPKAQRVAFYWLTIGRESMDKRLSGDSPEFDMFVRGAATRAP